MLRAPCRQGVGATADAMGQLFGEFTTRTDVEQGTAPATALERKVCLSSGECFQAPR